MCGIAGSYAGDKSRLGAVGFEGGLESAMDHIHRRGPDGRGVFTGQGLEAGHLRLSVLDPTDAAAQPMRSSCGRHVLLYNGEVYNYRELRDELIAAGESFDSTGDTEVVLAACVRFGVEEACRRFNGMFALAIFDRAEGVLALARDRFGIKPLYYRPEADQVSFASELKCFGRAAANGSLPEARVVLSMLAGAPHLGPGSPWQGVNEVEPGQVLRFSADRYDGEATVFCRIADMVDESLYREMSEGGWATCRDRFAEVFARAVQRHLASDVPVGVGLSGGVDSTAVLAAARATGARPLAFHAEVSGFEGERSFAELAARACDTSLAVATMEREDFARLLPELTWHNDYPLAYHTNSVPFALMARRASEQVKVLLTGEGADELLGGYGWIYDGIRQRRSARKGDLAARALARLRLSGLGGWVRRISGAGGEAVGGAGDYHRLRDLCNGHQAARWREEAAEAYGFLPQGDERTFAEGFFVTAHGHLQSLLWRNDRMGMLAGVESRFPFLDNELATLLLNTPMASKCHRGVRKAPLREAAVRLGVPGSIAARPKFAFSANPSFFCPVAASFFRGGFLEHYLPSIAQESPLADWDNFYFYLVATEVWGRLFVFGQEPGFIREDLLRHRPG